MEESEVRCYWAGQLVEKHKIFDVREEEDLIKIYQKDLSAGRMIFFTAGTVFVLTELCVDVMRADTLVTVYNLKK